MAAFWISPKGEIIYVKTTHITEVINNPEKFGFTSEFIEYVYKFYKEKIGQEGKAREQLMVALFKQGWIRIRKYRDFWSINVKVFSGKSKSLIMDWAKKILKGIHGYKEDDPFSSVKIDQDKKPIETMELKKLINMNEVNYFDRYGIIEVTIDNMDDLEPYDIVNETMNNKSNLYDYINESSLSRISKHIEKTENFGVISPFRKSNTDIDNIESYKKLAKDVRKMGYGYIELKGGYVGDEEFFSEKSLFIPNIKRDEVIELGKKYDQHSVISKNKDSFALMGTNSISGVGKILDMFNVSERGINIDDIGDKFQEFFSMLLKGSHKSKKFLFKMMERIETSMYYEKSHGEKWMELTVSESSLSRLWRHNLNHDCAALTAFRKARDCGNGETYTKSENAARNKSLLAKLKSMGYSVTSLKGKYPEGGSIGKEESFFVVDIKDGGNLLNDVKNLGEYFEQDSILFIPKGAIDNKSNAFLVGTNHCRNNWLGYGKTEKFKRGIIGKESKIYTSMVNGRPFIFEEVGETINDPGNGMGWWSLELAAKKHWSEFID